MKVGYYVRTEYGISKIIGIFVEGTMVFVETDNGLGNCNTSQNGKLRKGIIIFEEDYRNFIDNNVKEKIIDLIQEGDYVNGHKVIEIDLDDIDDYGNTFRYIKTEHDYTLNHWVKEYEIESIVTKEQFTSMEYKVGE